MKIKILFICYFILVTVQAQNTKKYFIPYQLSGKWGYADTLGNIYLKPNYERTSIDPSSYSETRFIVSKDKKYGVVDNQNKIFIPFEFDEISMEYSDDYKLQLFITKKNEKEGLYSLEGQQLLDTKNDEITFFKNECIFPEKIIDYSGQFYIIVDRGDKSGVYSYTVSTRKFKELIPIVFSKKKRYKNPETRIYIFENNKEYYALDQTGFIQITAEQYNIMHSYPSGYDKAHRSEKRDFFYKFIIKNGQIFKLELRQDNWDWNIKAYRMDTLEKNVLPINYKKAVLLNLNYDNWHTSPKFKEVGNILILNNGKKNAILSPLQIDKPIEYSYDKIDTLFTKELLDEGYPLIKVYKDKKWGMVNCNDFLVVSIQYDAINFFSPSSKALRDNMDYYGFIVKDKDKYYVLDKDHNYLSNYSFTEYEYFKEDEQSSRGFYIFNGDKKGIVYEMNVANKPIQLFKTKYPKKYKLEIERAQGYSLPIALIKVYDENNTFLGYADPKGIDYWSE